MMRIFPTALILSSLCCLSAQAATQVYKCTSTEGAIIFSDVNCPENTLQSTHTLLQPMLIPALSKQAIQQATRVSAAQHKKTRVTVVGEQSSPCGDSDPQQRRTAMVRKHVKSGMSMAEVESMFGKPINSNIHNGILTATYRSAKNQKRSVKFDEHGCVRLSQKQPASKKQSTHKK